MKPHTFHHSGTASLPTINLAQVRPEKVRSSTEPNQSLVPEPYQSIPAQDLLKDNCGFSGWIRKEGNSFKTCKLIQTYIIRISLSVQRKSAIGPHAGSRGDVFVVRTSKPVENLGKMGYFDRATGLLHILFTTNQETGAFGRPLGDVLCASEAMACSY